MQKTQRDPLVLPLLSEQQAAEAIWEYYKANKVNLVNNVAAHRAEIIAKAMAGISVADVFLPYIAPELPPLTKAKRRQ